MMEVEAYVPCGTVNPFRVQNHRRDPCTSGGRTAAAAAQAAQMRQSVVAHLKDLLEDRPLERWVAATSDTLV